MGSLEVITGGQYGSEGKGAIAAWRTIQAAKQGQVLGLRVAGPNAGHTVIGGAGVDTSNTIAPNLCERVEDASAIPAWQTDELLHTGRFAWRLRSVPVAAVVDPRAVVALSAGSEIDLPVLLNEIDMLEAAGYGISGRMYVDEEATLITDEHRYDEKYGRGSWEFVEALGGFGDDEAGPGTGIATGIGSTGKGIGAARADRLWRVPGVRLADNPDAIEALTDRGVLVVPDVADIATSFMRVDRATVIVEGTQGYGLGLRAGHYPYCTSSDCRAIDFLAMAGISPWAALRRDPDGTAWPSPLTVWVCLRPYPIRVGGNSGPLRGETSWDELGLPVEHTTVTGKVRRVGRWDGDLARRAIRANGGPGGVVKVAVTMMDTIVPEIAGWKALPGDQEPAPRFGKEEMSKAATRLAEEVKWLSRECQSPIAAVGTGPDTVLSLNQQ